MKVSSCNLKRLFEKICSGSLAEISARAEIRHVIAIVTSCDIITWRGYSSTSVPCGENLNCDGTMAHIVSADITDNEKKKKQLPILTIIDPTEFCIFPT